MPRIRDLRRVTERRRASRTRRFSSVGRDESVAFILARHNLGYRLHKGGEKTKVKTMIVWA